MAKTSSKNILHILIILIFNSFLAHTDAQILPENKIVNDTIRKADTIIIPQEQLESVVETKANNIRNDIPKKMTYLNKKAQVKDQDMQVEADYLSIDWNKSMIFASGELDSLGRI